MGVYKEKWIGREMNTVENEKNWKWNWRINEKLEETKLYYPAILFLNFFVGIMAISSHSLLFVWKSSVRRG